MKLIVGLGNPGKQYTKTRHNVGWLALDELAGKDKWKDSKKAKAFYIKKEINGQEVELLKPNTFMNNSGVAVAYAKKKHPKLNPEDIIVVHDDKDIKLGEIKVQIDRSSAGHNGIKSIIEHLGTQNFTRVRIGVAPANDSPIDDTSDFVLDKFTKEEKRLLSDVIQEAVSKLEAIIAG